ncbi:MAG: ABC transporter permease [Muribaculaceae bacterium]|nr:ABC transporter permease [Muribaculaceae bacterium]
MRGAPLALGIAWRYLCAPKTHGAVNAISIISVVGVAVATAAIVIVLSVFNGFRHHLNARLDTLTADVTVTPAYGKTISSGDSLATMLKGIPEIDEAMAEVTDNALVIAGTKEMPVTLKGVTPEVFGRITGIDSLLLDGTPVSGYSLKESSLSVGVAQRLGVYNPGEQLFVFAPKRKGRVNMANPAASFVTDSLEASSVFRSMQTEFDENTVICDISVAREMFQYEDEATSILLKLVPGADIGATTEKIRKILGEEFVVKDRMEQQEINFRMVAIEKWLTFTLLTFILVIASFNIISTLCMLILDKGGNLHTLSYIGMSRNRVGSIFWWESLLVTFSGALCGVIIGVGVSLLQEKFSLIKLAGDPSSLVIQAYPVKVEWLDIGVTMIPVLVIGLLTAWISRVFAIGRLSPFVAK